MVTKTLMNIGWQTTHEIVYLKKAGSHIHLEHGYVQKAEYILITR